MSPQGGLSEEGGGACRGWAKTRMLCLIIEVIQVPKKSLHLLQSRMWLSELHKHAERGHSRLPTTRWPDSLGVDHEHRCIVDH
jgi:hypothetical protein